MQINFFIFFFKNYCCECAYLNRLQNNSFHDHKFEAHNLKDNMTNVHVFLYCKAYLYFKQKQKFPKSADYARLDSKRHFSRLSNFEKLQTLFFKAHFIFENIILKMRICPSKKSITFFINCKKSSYIITDSFVCNTLFLDHFHCYTHIT